MATWFVDPVNGNDGNNGTTFALRKKTLGSLAAASLNSGDLIKFIESPAPVSIGNATWTLNSNTVTLAAAQTTNIDLCEASWTAAANVTASTSATRRQGSLSVSNAIASGFTTGKAAHRATGTLNLSAYSQVCLWFRADTTLAAGVLELRLCTDTSGNTAVHTFALPAYPVANIFQMVLLDNAGAMNSAIASVALYAASDPGTVTVLLDNILACNKGTLHLGSVIGKNTAGECFWPIESINDTTVTLARSAADITPSSGRGYKGASGTVTTYTRDLLRGVPASGNTTAVHQLLDGGAIGDPPTYITVSGGWNSTDMSTQTGETWIDGQNGNGRAFTNGGNQAFIKWEKLGAVRFYQGFFHQGSTTSQFGKFESCRAVMSQNDAFVLGGPQVDCTDCYAIGSGTAAGFSLGGPSGYNTFANCKSYQVNGPGFYLSGPHCTLRNCESYNNGTYGFQLLYGGSRGWNCSCGNNGTAGIIADGGADWTFFNLINENATEVSFVYSNTAAVVRSQNHDNVVGSHKSWMYGHTWESDTSVVEGSTRSLKVNVTSTDRNSVNPARVLVGRIAVKANEISAITAYLRRNNSSMNVRFIVPGGQLAGLPNDIYEDLADTDTWAETSLYLDTPTEDGVVEVYAYCWGGTTHSAWVDTVRTAAS
jgi:hypothetical protein